MKEIAIRYLFNSGFSIETESLFLVIDYEKGPLTLPRDKEIYFIVTHAHKDHYNPDIFSLPHTESAKYILSDDVEAPAENGKVLQMSDSIEQTARRKIVFNRKRSLRVSPGQSGIFGSLSYHTFGSTDRGISILLEICGLFFFHAGDLNAWKWPEFSLEEQQKEVAMYKRVLQEVAAYPVDISFCALDGRLGKNAFLGPEMQIDILSPQLFLPMHFRENTEITRLFQKYKQPNTSTVIQTIDAPGQRFLIRNE
ncbi:MAG: hypothetical protein MSC57_07355 [Peptoniphilaceae bacterium]|nr:hypothetical protein [Peptoniphilaceae bacterium]